MKAESLFAGSHRMTADPEVGNAHTTTKANSFRNTDEIPNVTASTVNASDITSSDVDPLDTVRNVMFVVMGVIIILGLLCNLFSSAVFISSRKLRRTTSGTYLLALTIADLLFLTGDLLRWLNTKHSDGSYLVTFMNTNPVACKGVFFLRYGAKLSSAWLVVAITAERYLSVRFPLKVASISTPKNTRVVIACIVCQGFLLGAYPLWTVGTAISGGKTLCLIVSMYEYTVWSWVSLRVGSLLLPGILMCVLTALMLHQLARAHADRMSRAAATGRAGSSSTQQQLTATLLAIAVAFVVLRLPYCVTYPLNQYKTQIWPDINTHFSHQIYIANRVSKRTSLYAVLKEMSLEQEDRSESGKPRQPTPFLGYVQISNHAYCDLSVSFKVKSDGGVEAPYIISNQKKSPLFSLGQIPPPPPHTHTSHPYPQGIFFFISSLITYHLHLLTVSEGRSCII